MVCGDAQLTNPYLFSGADAPDWSVVKAELANVEDRLRDWTVIKGRVELVSSAAILEKADHWLGMWLLHVGRYYVLCDQEGTDSGWLTVASAYEQVRLEARDEFMRVAAWELNLGALP